MSMRANPTLVASLRQVGLHEQADALEREMPDDGDPPIYDNPNTIFAPGLEISLDPLRDVVIAVVNLSPAGRRAVMKFIEDNKVT